MKQCGNIRAGVKLSPLSVLSALGELGLGMARVVYQLNGQLSISHVHRNELEVTDADR